MANNLRKLNENISKCKQMAVQKLGKLCNLLFSLNQIKVTA